MWLFNEVHSAAAALFAQLAQREWKYSLSGFSAPLTVSQPQRAAALRLAELCESMQQHMATYFSLFLDNIMVTPRRRNMEKAETNHSCHWPSLRQPQYPGARPQTRWRSTVPARTPEAPLSRTQCWCSLWHWQVLWDRLHPVLWSPWWWRSWPFHAASVTERSHLTEEKCSGNGIKRDIRLGLKTVNVKDEDTDEHICLAFFQPDNRLLEFSENNILYYIMTI